MRIQTIISFLILVALLTGCAASYHSLNPEHIPYSSNNLDDGIAFSYRFNVLREARNKKYAKHEEMHNIKLVAVKITNHTGKTLDLSRDVSFFVGDREVIPMDQMEVKAQLKQGVMIYLLYMLLTPVQLYTNVSSSNDEYGMENQNESSIPIGLFLGPGITLGNMLGAGGANKNFERELLDYTINAQVDEGKTVYALVGFRDIGFEPITLKLKK